MPFNVRPTLEAMLSYLQASGRVQHAQIGEPKAPPSSGSSAAIYMNNARITKVTLGGSTIEQHVVTIRLYRNMLAEPEGENEYALSQAVAEISDDLLGDFDLGAT